MAQAPRGGPFSASHSSSSGIHSVSAPACSSRSAIARISGHRAVSRPAPHWMIGKVTPTSKVATVGLLVRLANYDMSAAEQLAIHPVDHNSSMTPSATSHSDQAM